MSPKPAKPTTVEKSEFKGQPTIAIYELEESGDKSQYPLISFGKKKAQAIIKHLEEIKALAES